MKELLWQLFKNTGKIEYYLEYKKKKDVDSSGGNNRESL